MECSGVCQPPSTFWSVTLQPLGTEQATIWQMKGDIPSFHMRYRGLISIHRLQRKMNFCPLSFSSLVCLLEMVRNQFPEAFLCHVKVNPSQTTSLHKPSCGRSRLSSSSNVSRLCFPRSGAVAVSPSLRSFSLARRLCSRLPSSSHSVIGTSRKTRPHSQRRRQKQGTLLSRTCDDA